MPATTNEILMRPNGANVFSVAVKWGYLGSPQPVELWGADLIVHNPSEILEIKLTK